MTWSSHILDKVIEMRETLKGKLFEFYSFSFFLLSCPEDVGVLCLFTAVL